MRWRRKVARGVHVLGHRFHFEEVTSVRTAEEADEALAEEWRKIEALIDAIPWWEWRFGVQLDYFRRFWGWLRR